jgi:uncharacterized protein YhaN
MKLNNIHIEAFGQLEDADLDFSSSNIVVIQGQNEAGKSTLFNLLQSMLYGFYPASAESFPYRPWHADKYPEYSAELTLDNGREIQVYRKLMTSPTAQWTEGGKSHSLRNKNLPFVKHVTRDLYRSLYAITQANIRSIEEEERSEIEDRLLGSLSSDAIRSSREVAEELKDEAYGLWRPDRRGKPMVQKLRQQLRETRERKKEAEEIERQLHQNIVRLENVKEKIDQLQRETDELNAAIRKAESLLPARRKIEHVEKLENQIPDLEAVKRLPVELGGQFQRCLDDKANADKRLKSLEAELQEQKKLMERFTSYDQNILGKADTLEKWIRIVYSHLEEKKDLQDKESRFEKLHDEINEIAGRTLSDPWQEEYGQTLENMDLIGLKRNIDEFQHLDEDARHLQATELTDTADAIRGIPPMLHRIMISAGIILSLGGMILSVPIVFAGGLPLVILGSACLAFNLYLNRQKSAVKSRKVEKIEEIDTRKSRNIRAIKNMLASLPVNITRLTPPDTSLLKDLQQLQSLLKERNKLGEELKGEKSDWELANEELKDLCMGLGEPDPGIEAVNRLGEKLKEARDHRNESRQASRRIQQIEREKQEFVEILESREEKLEEMRNAMADAVGERLPDGQALMAAEKLQEKADDIRRIEKQLIEDHGDIAELHKQIYEAESSGAMEAMLNEIEVESARRKTRENQERLNELSGEKASLETRIEAAQDHDSAGELEGEMDWIREQIEDACRKHDRLMLMRGILLEADRRFREKHQPDVLKRASKYLNTITGGRYKSLTIMETPEGEEKLTIVEASGGHHPVAFPLSGGTLDQIYLSFRLAVIEHLDQNAETLPLVMDEVLINWDVERFERGQEIIADVAENHQVFLLTCHNWITDRIMKALPAVNIKL